jgi:hypothetical protein
MNPECRPMSLTSPTPPGADRASTLAAWMDLVASDIAVWKPKLGSM